MSVIYSSNSSSYKKCIIECPIVGCQSRGIIKIEYSFMNGCISGTRIFHIRKGLICKDHHIVVYLDHNLDIRGYLKPIHSFIEPPKQLYLRTHINQKELGEFDVPVSQCLFSLDPIGFRTLFVNFFYFSPIIIIYENKRDLKIFKNLFEIFRLFNKEFLKYVFIIENQKYEEEFLLFKNTDMFCIYNLSKLSTQQNPVGNKEIELFADISHSFYTPNFMECFKDLKKISLSILKNIHKFSARKMLSKEKKHCKWVNSSTINFIIFRFETIARSVHLIWGDKFDFVSDKVHEYIKKQNLADIEIQRINTRVDSIF